MNNIRSICGHGYEMQEVNAFLQFQVINAVQTAYDDHGKESGLSMDEWLSQGIRRFNKHVVLPLVEVVFEPIGNAPSISKLMTSRTFEVEDFKVVTEALQSFSSSVTDNSVPQGVTLATLNAKGKHLAAQTKKVSKPKSTSRKSTAS